MVELMNEKIENAKSYPFFIPASSYLFVNNEYFNVIEWGEEFKDSKILVTDKPLKLGDYLRGISAQDIMDFDDCVVRP
jgi:hypothetical protein